MKAPSTCLALLLVVANATAQDSAELRSLTFTPGPIIGDHMPPPAAADESEPADDDQREVSLLDAVQRLTESLSRQEALNGPRSSSLIPDLAALSGLYLELGETALAIAVLERARHVSRSNDGLHSLEQASIVDQLIDAMQTAGLVDEAAALQNSLLELARRNEGDSRAPSVLASVAGRQLDAVHEYLESGRWPGTREPMPDEDVTGWDPSTPEAERLTSASKLGRLRDRVRGAVRAALESHDYHLGDSLGLDAELAEIYVLADTYNDYVEEGIGKLRNVSALFEIAFNDRELALEALRRARRVQSAGVQAALAGGGDRGELFALERQLVETYYLEHRNPELHTLYLRKGSGSAAPLHVRGAAEVIYVTGASVLEAKVVNRLQAGTSPIDVAWALVELGDWHLLASRNGQGLETYQSAHDFLVKHGVAADDIGNVFSPDVPAILPAFSASAAVFDPARAYRGYVDVAVQTGRYGQPVRVDIAAASPGASNAIKHRARGHVAQTRYRPRFVDGRPARSDRFTLRYYFDYQAPGDY